MTKILEKPFWIHFFGANIIKKVPKHGWMEHYQCVSKYVELSPQYSKFHVYTQIDIKMIKYIIYP